MQVKEEGADQCGGSVAGWLAPGAHFPWRCVHLACFYETRSGSLALAHESCDPLFPLSPCPTDKLASQVPGAVAVEAKTEKGVRACRRGCWLLAVLASRLLSACAPFSCGSFANTLRRFQARET